MAEKNEGTVYSLEWNDFKTNYVNGINKLRYDGLYSDAVLFSDDGKLYKVHRVILSVISPYFKKIFGKLPDQHPVCKYFATKRRFL